MGAVSGVAVALGATAPPVPEEPPLDQSPGLPADRPPAAARARPVCAGSPSGAGTSCSRPRPSPGSSSTGAGCCRLRRRGDTWPWLRDRVVDRRHGPVLLGHQRRTRALRARPVQRAHGPAHGARDGRAAVPRAVRTRHAGAARPAGPVHAAARRRLPRPPRVDPHARRQPRRALPRAPRRRRRELHRVDAALLLLRPVRVVAAQPRRAPRDGRALHRRRVPVRRTRSSASTPARAASPYPQRLLLLFATMVFHAFFGVDAGDRRRAAGRRLVRAHGPPLGRLRDRRPADRRRDHLGHRRDPDPRASRSAWRSPGPATTTAPPAAATARSTATGTSRWTSTTRCSPTWPTATRTAPA